MFQLFLGYWNTVVQRKNLGNLEVEIRTFFINIYIKKLLDWEIEYKHFLRKLSIFSINNICTLLSK